MLKMQKSIKFYDSFDINVTLAHIFYQTFDFIFFRFKIGTTNFAQILIGRDNGRFSQGITKL